MTQQQMNYAMYQRSRHAAMTAFAAKAAGAAKNRQGPGPTPPPPGPVPPPAPTSRKVTMKAVVDGETIPDMTVAMSAGGKDSSGMSEFLNPDASVQTVECRASVIETGDTAQYPVDFASAKVDEVETAVRTEDGFAVFEIPAGTSDVTVEAVYARNHRFVTAKTVEDQFGTEIAAGLLVDETEVESGSKVRCEAGRTTAVYALERPDRYRMQRAYVNGEERMPIYSAAHPEYTGAEAEPGPTALEITLSYSKM